MYSSLILRGDGGHDFPMTERMKDRLRLTAEDLDAVRANLDWQALFEGLGLQKAGGVLSSFRPAESELL